MNYEEAKSMCHVRSGIYRKGNATKIYTNDDLNQLPERFREINRHNVGTIVPNVYWKNHQTPLDERVPDEEKVFDDWEEYDPRERPECSQFNELPA